MRCARAAYRSSGSSMSFTPCLQLSIACSCSMGENLLQRESRAPLSKARKWRKFIWVSTPMPDLLQVKAIDVFYGDFQALFGVSLSVEAGQITAVIGANGAGKSTLLKTIAG